jgi:hypothetical protein
MRVGLPSTLHLSSCNLTYILRARGQCWGTCQGTGKWQKSWPSSRLELVRALGVPFMLLGC